MQIRDLPTESHDLAATSLAWLDACRDSRTGLFRAPGDAEPRVRESAWLAHGLLLRGSPADRRDAARLLDRILDAQLVAPGERWHGTFRRTPSEPTPTTPAREWVDYDPNWRQFVGCALALIVREHERDLPAALAERIARAIALARAGEPEGRISARYTNVALMQAWLDAEAGDPRGASLADAIVRAFDAHGAFDEFGSPTYYGVDLYALALWTAYGRTDALRAAGRRLTEALWSEIGEVYHAGLRNVAGPYTRAYGMDLCRYASLVGLWIWAAAGGDAAPVPEATRAPGRPFPHAHDFALAPSVAVLAARAGAPADARVRRRLARFDGERAPTRVLSTAPRRVATAWLGRDAMIGADANETDWHDWEQYHAATIHWRDASGRVGWLRLRHDGPVDATASPGRLTATLADPGDRRGRGTRFELSARSLAETPLSLRGDADDLDAGTLALPGGRTREIEIAIDLRSCGPPT